MKFKFHSREPKLSNLGSLCFELISKYKQRIKLTKLKKKFNSKGVVQFNDLEIIFLFWNGLSFKKILKKGKLINYFT